MRLPPADAVARFRDDLHAVQPWLDADAPLLVAVSGGADSVALLLLAHAAFGARCHAATVDHSLRPQSAREALRVGRLCAALGVRHATLAGAMPARTDKTTNVSARARVLRYRLLEAHAHGLDPATRVLTGHHADDQLETFVMRLNRASGLSGLSGIRGVNGCVVRPLLTWTHAELARIVQGCGITPVDDPTNRDDRYDRARLRKELATTTLFDAVAVARSMAALAQANDALDTIADTHFADVWHDAASGPIELDVTGLHDEIVRRVAIRLVTALDPAARPGRSAVERLARLMPGEKQCIGDVIVEYVSMPIVEGDESDPQLSWPVYRFYRAPPRRSARVAVVPAA